MNPFFYSIESTYHSTSFLCEAIVKSFDFNIVSTYSSDVHAYELMCSPNDGSKNQLNNYFSIPLMP